MANKPLKSIKFPGLNDTYTVPEVDATLATTGAAADAKKVGDEINDLKADLSKIEPGLSAEAKAALLACFENAAWVGTDGQNYYDALYDALYNDGYPKLTVEYVNRGHIVFTSDNIDTLKNYLTVKYFENSSSTGSVVPASQYTLSGTLSAGANMIRASYNNTSTTFVVNAESIVVPSEYTRKDYIKVKDDKGEQGFPVGGVIRANLGKNLNALSYYTQLYVESTVQGSAGWALIGGRTQSGYTSSVGLYYSEKIKWLGAQIHGTDTGVYTPPGEIKKDTVTNISFYNGRETPSVLTADGISYNVQWLNDTAVMVDLNLFINRAPTDTTAYCHRHIRLGNIDIRDFNNDRVHYLVPSIRNSDNVIGWYDAITGSFFTAQTTSYATSTNSNCVYALGDW